MSHTGEEFLCGGAKGTAHVGGVALCSPQTCTCKGRCGRVEAEAETPSPASAQARAKPVGVDGELWSTSGRTFSDMCLPKD